MATLKGSNSLMTMDRTKAASALGDSYLSERKARGSRPSLGTISSEFAPFAATVSRDIDERAGDNTRAEAEKEARDAKMGLTTSKDVRDLQKATSFQNRFGQAIAKKVPTYLAAAFAPALLGPVMGLTAAYGAFQTGLGALASGMESLEEGVLGDIAGTRSRERARDTAEKRGYSREQTSKGAEADRDIGGYTGLGPGLGRHGFGLDPGLSDMDPYGGYSLGDIDMGRDPGGGDPGGGLDPGSDLGGLGGEIGETGPTSRGKMSASLGTNAASGGYEGFGRGSDSGGDSGGGRGHGSSGGMGGGSDRDSSPGGMGGV
jgi:hypothetical protein